MSFTPGENLALKVPPVVYLQTVQFYRDVLGLKVVVREEASVAFAFGGKTLWVDRVEGLATSELWLEVVAEDVEEAARTLAAAGIERCDEVEKLPAGFRGFWIKSPAGTVHLVSESAPGR